MAQVSEHLSVRPPPAWLHLHPHSTLFSETLKYCLAGQGVEELRGFENHGDEEVRSCAYRCLWIAARTPWCVLVQLLCSFEWLCGDLFTLFGGTLYHIRSLVVMEEFCTFAEVSPSIGKVRVKHMKKLIALKGTVIRSGGVKMIEFERCYMCRKCKHRFVMHISVLFQYVH